MNKKDRLVQALAYYLEQTVGIEPKDLDLESERKRTLAEVSLNGAFRDMMDLYFYLTGRYLFEDAGKIEIKERKNE